MEVVCERSEWTREPADSLLQRAVSAPAGGEVTRAPFADHLVEHVPGNRPVTHGQVAVYFKGVLKANRSQNTALPVDVLRM